MLILTGEKSPVFVRSIMFLFAFLFFLMPLTGIVLYIASGNAFHIGFLFVLFFFCLIGFYLLRIALWITYGNEVILCNKNGIK